MKKPDYLQIAGYVSLVVLVHTANSKYQVVDIFLNLALACSADFQLRIELNPTGVVTRSSCFYHRADNKSH